MSDKEITAGLPILTNSNYVLWTRKLNGNFRIHGLYDLVHGNEKRPEVSDATGQADWDKWNQKAAGIIETTVDEDDWTHIGEHEGNAYHVNELR
ncbi:hypothetical protein FRC14_004321 [Serendipita sp. 396]|nr:hypothetical protein FRC14_004321 [Serendipita sp. 396]KAG8787060.1 hypothetical protein FRC15_010136 [Serendipita sp. 397]KAG8866568.1 hypothetical protein FRC20_008118 [Serendipita sp. 405]